MCISYLHLQYVLIYKNIYIDIYQIWLGNRFINYNKQYKIFRGSSTKYWDPNVIVRMVTDEWFPRKTDRADQTVSRNEVVTRLET